MTSRFTQLYKKYKKSTKKEAISSSSVGLNPSMQVTLGNSDFYAKGRSDIPYRLGTFKRKNKKCKCQCCKKN